MSNQNLLGDCNAQQHADSYLDFNSLVKLEIVYFVLYVFMHLVNTDLIAVFVERREQVSSGVATENV